jgi:DNA repair protein RadC
MNDMSVKSRAELVDELVASSHPPTVSEASAAYASPVNATAVEDDDAIVCRKLAVAREILLRDLIAQMQAGPVLGSPDTVRSWLKLHCAGLEHEVFIVLHLDVRNRLIKEEEIFRGTLAHTCIYPREVVKSALLCNASSVVLAHNHPGGNPEPSSADRVLTTQLASALAAVDVRVIDHFIVAGDCTYSFAERGLL